MSWCFADEATIYTNGVRDSLARDSAVVPSIWPLEVANVLTIAERRNRLREADALRFVALMQSLPIAVDDETSQKALREVLGLAREYQISAYDAAYLDLALRKGLCLASLDGRLKDAAIRAGAPLFEG